MYSELIDAVVADRGFVTEFSEEEEMAAAEAAALTHDLSKRADYRQQELVTIDGADAYDFDDAVSCRRLPDGDIYLLVAIADVSAYVPPYSVLDQAALRRGNSVYLPDRVIPMLPAILSGEICSLKEKEERLALCCEMHFMPNGTVRRYRFFRAVVRSAVRLTYEEATAMMNGEADTSLTTLPLLRQLAEVLREQRRQRGSMLIELPEKHCRITDDNELKISESVRDISHWAIEEAMIAANRCAADFLIQKRRPALHRVHAKPAGDKVQQLGRTLQPLGFSLPRQPSAADFGDVLMAVEARNHTLAQALTPMVLGTMARAEYAPDEKKGHFGLACERYTHFTSPIRRYPDLLTHRAIIAALDNAPIPFKPEELTTIGTHCGETEVKADKAHWDSKQRLLCVGAQSLIGCEYEGYVSGIGAMGLFVTVGELGIDGMVRFSKLSGYWECDAERKAIISPDKTTTIKVTDKLAVQLISVTPEKGRVDFIATAYCKNRYIE